MLTTYRIAKTAVTAFFGVGVFVFFGYAYPEHLHYQEQYQLFQHTAQYASEVIPVPGGLADYIGRFVVQFFYQPIIGALILAGLLMMMQMIGWKLLTNRPLWFYPLSFLPALAMWMFYCDENAMLSALVAVLITMLATWGVVHMPLGWLRRTLIFLGMPVLYMLCGSLAILYPVVALIWECRHKHSLRVKTALCTGAFVLAALIPVAAHVVFPYPFERLTLGVHYYRFPQIIAALPWCSVMLIAALTLASCFVKSENTSHSHHYVTFGALIVALIFAAFYSIGASTNFLKEETMAYDNMARHKQWSQIIEKASKQSPHTTMGVASLNLALGMTGQLGDFMFMFYQNGVEGLLPAYERDYTSPLPTSEAYYQLGMLNTAQRYIFEAQEAIPDFQKSARCYRRLAEINLINGNYAVAEKYLKTLQSTMVYSDWANKTLTLLADEDAINNHAEYGRLRQAKYKRDFLFNEPDIDSMLGLLYLDSDSKNKLAYEYLMAWCLLAKNLPRFYECLPLGQSLDYARMPISHQEALLLAWWQQYGSLDGLRWPLSQQIVNRFHSFLQDLQAKRPAAYMANQYKGSYWNYFFGINQN